MNRSVISIDKEFINKTILEHKDLLDKYKVKSIALFGSYVREEQKEDSDIDLLVEFDLLRFGHNFHGYSDNFDEFKNFLRQILGRNIDLITEDMISPFIRPYIQKEIIYLEAR